MTWRQLLIVTFIIWLPVALGMTLLFGFRYWVSQNNAIAMSYVDQTFVVRSLKKPLDQGYPPATVLKYPSTKILVPYVVPYVVVFDNDGNELAATANLQGEIRRLPAETLKDAVAGNRPRITWQAKLGVSLSAVVQKYRYGFVVAGKDYSYLKARLDRRRSFYSTVGLLSLVGSFLIIAVGIRVFDIKY